MGWRELELELGGCKARRGEADMTTAVSDMVRSCRRVCVRVCVVSVPWLSLELSLLSSSVVRHPSFVALALALAHARIAPGLPSAPSQTSSLNCVPVAPIASLFQSPTPPGPPSTPSAHCACQRSPAPPSPYTVSCLRGEIRTASKSVSRSHCRGGGGL
jgi:hypothetical protein